MLDDIERAYESRIKALVNQYPGFGEGTAREMYAHERERLEVGAHISDYLAELAYQATKDILEARS